MQNGNLEQWEMVEIPQLDVTDQIVCAIRAAKHVDVHLWPRCVRRDDDTVIFATERGGAIAVACDGLTISWQPSIALPLRGWQPDGEPIDVWTRRALTLAEATVRQALAWRGDRR